MNFIEKPISPPNIYPSNYTILYQILLNVKLFRTTKEIGKEKAESISNL
ncbi:hypothetical protein DET49_13814 [Salegentibacter sp. 24]|nr:hypothetical protein DET49_13814 [Salegentibacter sp. 24]